MKKTITRIFGAVALSILALSTACAAPEEPAPIGETPATGTQPTATTPPAAAPNQPQEQPAQTTVILENRPTLFPTRERPQRLDLTDAMAAVSPTNTPEPTPTETMLNTPTAIPEEVAEPHMTEMMPTGPADEASGIPAVPENPQLDDSVRVQDIYQHMDLSQYALDPQNLHGRSKEPGKGKHPYTFITNTWKSPVIYFIHHPWFEAAYHPKRAAGTENNRLPPRNHFRYRHYNPQWIQRNESNYLKLPMSGGVGPRWFGDNSLKGVILQSVANTLEQAVKPGTEKKTIKWGQRQNEKSGKLEQVELNLSIEEYLSVTASIDKISRSEAEAYDYGAFNRPKMNWEFVHPELPIIRIIAEYNTALPLTNPEDERTRPANVEFRTSTVVAFQNRWNSFTDTNRWLIRFQPYYEFRDYAEKNGVHPISTRPDNGRYQSWIELYRRTDPEHWDLFPFYWHATDYMPHSIIGPVVTEVIESDVLEPGIYSHTPRLTQWTAPGPILTTEQLSDYWANIQITNTTLEGKETYGTNEWGARIILWENIVFNTEHDFLAPRTGPSPYGPNPNFPFPGHLSATEYHLPGSEGWNYFDLDSVDWDW